MSFDVKFDIKIYNLINPINPLTGTETFRVVSYYNNNISKLDFPVLFSFPYGFEYI
jgi:hypothetical protein